MKTHHTYTARHIIRTLATMLVAACCTALAVPLSMDYDEMDRTNFFERWIGLAPTVSNVLRVMEQPEAFALDPTEYWSEDYKTTVRGNCIALLPYLVTPADSNAVIAALHACAARHTNSFSTLYHCAEAFINTTFDIAGGLHMHHTLMSNLAAPLHLRIRCASALMRRGILAGYDVMIEGLASSNRNELAPAGDLLLSHRNYICEHSASDGSTVFFTQEGRPIDLTDAARVTMSNTAAPLGIRLWNAGLLLDLGIPTGYDLIAEGFASTNRYWQELAEKLFLGYTHYVRKHVEEGDARYFTAQPGASDGSRQLTTLEGTPIDLADVARYIRHPLFFPSLTNNLQDARIPASTTNAPALPPE